MLPYNQYVQKECTEIAQSVQKALKVFNQVLDVTTSG